MSTLTSVVDASEAPHVVHVAPIIREHEQGEDLRVIRRRYVTVESETLCGKDTEEMLTTADYGHAAAAVLTMCGGCRMAVQR